MDAWDGYVRRRMEAVRDQAAAELARIAAAVQAEFDAHLASWHRDDSVFGRN